MKVLIVKTSSLGDVIHTLPAVTEAKKQQPEIQFDWVVEEPFAEIPKWHPAVNRVIVIDGRRWRKQPGQFFSGEGLRFYRALRHSKYDAVIDAQGLIKSALVTRLAQGTRWGLDAESAREPVASIAYKRRVSAPKNLHAVKRIQKLFATSLGYNHSNDKVDYGIDHLELPAMAPEGNYIVFLHGTTWASKHWPKLYWKELLEQITNNGLSVYLPWHTPEEKRFAEHLSEGSNHVHTLPQLNLSGIAATLASAQAAVTVDTGLSHLATALGTPTVTLYGATEPTLTGTYGEAQVHLQADFPCAPCFKRECSYRMNTSVKPACYAKVPPLKVWEALQYSLNLDPAVNRLVQ